MSYDIYGNPLRRGHCEVHPHVHEEYPCSVCVAESRRQQEAQIPAWCDGNPAHCESAHYLGQAQEEIKRLNDEIQSLRKDSECLKEYIQMVRDKNPSTPTFDGQHWIVPRHGGGYRTVSGDIVCDHYVYFVDAIRAAMEQQHD